MDNNYKMNQREKRIDTMWVKSDIIMSVIEFPIFILLLLQYFNFLLFPIQYHFVLRLIFLGGFMYFIVSFLTHRYLRRRNRNSYH